MHRVLTHEWRSEDSTGSHTSSLDLPAAAPWASSAHRPRSLHDRTAAGGCKGRGLNAVCILKHCKRVQPLLVLSPPQATFSTINLKEKLDWPLS